MGKLRSFNEHDWHMYANCEGSPLIGDAGPAAGLPNSTATVVVDDNGVFVDIVVAEGEHMGDSMYMANYACTKAIASIIAEHILATPISPASLRELGMKVCESTEDKLREIAGVVAEDAGRSVPDNNVLYVGVEDGLEEVDNELNARWESAFMLVFETDKLVPPLSLVAQEVINRIYWNVWQHGEPL